MSILISLLSFILVLGGLVLIHEFGHFIIAKLCDVYVEEFAIGMGPKLFSFRKGETLYRINLFPIGGYVKMLGEQDDSQDPRSFNRQSILKRMLIVTGGVMMNILLAGVAYFILLSISSFTLIIPQIVDYQFKFAQSQNVIFVDYVAENSPAFEVGLEPGDVILSVNQREITSMEEFKQLVNQNAGEEIVLSVIDYSGDNERTIELTPRINPPENEGPIGISMVEAVKITYTGIHKIFSGFEHSFNMIAYTLVILKDLINRSFATGDISYVSDTISGPVGVYVVTDMVIKTAGLVGLLDIIALMSSSLAFMNLLPFPALDGGHVVLLLLEKIRGKRLNSTVESWLTATGFIVLMGFMLLITVKDLFQFGFWDWIIFWN